MTSTARSAFESSSRGTPARGPDRLATQVREADLAIVAGEAHGFRRVASRGRGAASFALTA